MHYQCPHCRQRGIPLWNPAKCLTCGTEVTTTLGSFLWCTTPFGAVLALVWIFFGFNTPAFWMLWAVLALGSMWVNYKFLVWIEK